MAIDRDELHRLWTGTTLTIREIGARFGTTENAIARAIRRARKDEGLERWPKRATAAKPRETPRPPSRVKPGAATLPPLRSLDP